VCLRANIARKLTGLAYCEFCVRLADSPLLQWFLQVGQIDQVKVFSKSTSHRFDAWLKPESLCQINLARALETIQKPTPNMPQPPLTRNLKKAADGTGSSLTAPA